MVGLSTRARSKYDAVQEEVVEMQPRTRTQYMYGNPVFRTQRNRMKPLNNQLISASNLWRNIPGIVGDEIFTDTARPTGFSNATSLRVVVPSSIVASSVYCYVVSTAISATWLTNSSYIVNSISCTIGGTTIVSIKPGDYVAFALLAEENPGSITVTVNNQVNKATSQVLIDSFTATWT